MKVALVVHGYPPELLGGTELSVQAVARGLVERGIEVIVVAGSMRHEDGFRVSEETDGDIRVLRIHRADLFFEHWQKSLSARVATEFQRILSEEKVDLVHVHHWIRLTRDLVQVAARAGVPAVVTLHDLWTSCLVSFRVPPGSDEFCEAPLGPSPCLACAEKLPPRTPWVSMENRFMAVHQRRVDLMRELELARRVLVPTRAHGEAVCGFLGMDPAALGLEVLPHGRELDLEPTLAREAPKTAAQADSPDDGRLVLGSWGHVHSLKGQDLMVEAMHGLDDPLRVTLHVAGGTPDPEFVDRLKSQAEGLDVHLHGPFEQGELGNHAVSRVDCMISASRGHESWGLVVDEAVALGLPMILPESGAFRERMSEANGAFFFEPRKSASLTALLQRLLDRPELVAEARRRILEQGSIVPGMGDHLDQLLVHYRAAREAGAPEMPEADWWAARMQTEAERAWDEGLQRADAEELGFE